MQQNFNWEKKSAHSDVQTKDLAQKYSYTQTRLPVPPLEDATKHIILDLR